MKLFELGDGGMAGQATVTVRLSARAGRAHTVALIKATAARWRENLGSFG